MKLHLNKHTVSVLRHLPVGGPVAGTHGGQGGRASGVTEAARHPFLVHEAHLALQAHHVAARVCSEEGRREVIGWLNQ